MDSSDGLRMSCISRTLKYAQFSMPPFRGHLEILNLGGGPVAYLLKNFDGVHGLKIAKNLESTFGFEVLSGTGTQAKCAAAMGNNCQDKYSKIYPPRMFLDGARGNMMKNLLDSTMNATNQSLQLLQTSSKSSKSSSQSSQQQLSMQQRPAQMYHNAYNNTLQYTTGGPKIGEQMIGESQILRFISPKKNIIELGKSKNRMHVHTDCPGSRWVAITSVGDTGKFVFDNALNCTRCYLPKRGDKRSKPPNVNRGGTGDNKIHAKNWHTVDCKTCKNIQLQSGDCLLFYGHPSALVAHGSIGTVPATCPSSLPSWAKGGRISCQYRLTDFVERTNAHGGHTFGLS